jgi:hypothetical protein
MSAVSGVENHGSLDSEFSVIRMLSSVFYSFLHYSTYLVLVCSKADLGPGTVYFTFSYP